jgi:hypothetical protein
MAILLGEKRERVESLSPSCYGTSAAIFNKS